MCHKEMRMNRRFYLLKGFSLIELSIVLLIIGIIAGAVMKGTDLIEAARIRSILNDLNKYSVAFMLYQETNQALPGDDSKAQDRFGQDVTNGDGDGKITGNDIAKAWQHLGKAGHINVTSPPSSKLGGKYYFVSNPLNGFSGTWLILSEESGGQNLYPLLTPQQAQAIKQKIEEGPANEGSLRVTEGTGAQAGSCINVNGILNLQTKDKVCILLSKVEG